MRLRSGGALRFPTRIDNPIQVPAILSFLAYGSFSANVKGLKDFPREQWPPNIEMLYYAYHIMVGLGTLLILVMGIAALLSWRSRLQTSRAMLWVLMLAFPFPYIARSAGWTVAELGRQPWLVYNLLRTAQGVSPKVHAGETVFTSLGFAGIYLVLSLLFLFLMGREIADSGALDHPFRPDPITHSGATRSLIPVAPDHPRQPGSGGFVRGALKVGWAR